MSLAELVAGRQVLVCVGHGGVGKTTVAAALGLGAALQGRRVLVLTVDPARRLAQALGLETLRAGGEPVDPARLAAAGLALEGSLSAGMLDVHQTWDDLVARLAPTDAARDAILGNAFYQSLSEGFAGASEYAALEALCRAAAEPGQDLLVLDTPPAVQALDLLEAPARLEAFLGSGMVRRLATLRDRKVPGARHLGRAWRYVMDRLERATGVEALAAVAELFGELEALGAGLGERARDADRILRGPGTAFVLVTAPDTPAAASPGDLAGTLEALRMPPAAVVVNRAHPLPGVDGPGVRTPGAEAVRAVVRGAAPTAPAPVVDHLVATHGAAWAGACREAAAVEVLAERLPAATLTVVPEGPRDVHDLSGLAGVASALFAP